MAKKDLSPLVLAAQRGDQQAMSDLLEASYRDLYFYAYQTVKNEDLAADITQESCLEIIATISQLREPNAFVIWARRITYHQCTRFFRESKEITVEANEDGETIFDQIPDENEGTLPEQVQLDKEFRATMQQLLDELPAQQRTALMLYYYEKLSVSQIAQIQDTTEGTVKSRLNYGRKAVKAKVEEYEKKTGVRLHSIAPLPLLLLFLFGRQGAEVLASSSLGAVWQAVSGSVAAGAGTAAAGAATTGAAAGTAAATGSAITTGTATGTAAAAVGTSLGVKIAAGVVAAAVCIGGTIGGAALIKEAFAKVPQELCGTWYGDQYTEEHPNDVLILEADGTLEFHGYTFDLARTEKDEEDSTGKDMDLYFVYETERPDCGKCQHTGVLLDCDWLEDDEHSDSSYHTGPGYLISVRPLRGEHANGEEAVAPFYEDPADAYFLFHHYYQKESRFRDDIWGKWVYQTDSEVAESFTLQPNHRIVYNGNTYHWRAGEISEDKEYSDFRYSINVYDFEGDAEIDYCCRTEFDHHAKYPCTRLFEIQIVINYAHEYPDVAYLFVTHGKEKAFFRPDTPGNSSLAPDLTQPEETEVPEETRIPSEGLEFRENGDSYAVAGIGECADSDIVIPAEYMGKPVTRIDDWAFEHVQGIVSVTIPDSVTYIGNRAFWGIETLESIRLSENLTILEEYVLWDCISLKEIHIPASVKMIEHFAFSGCNSLTQVTIPETVTYIGTGAFYQCAALQEVNLPATLRTLSYSAFFECPALDEVTFAGTAEQLLALDTRETSFEFKSDYSNVDWDKTDHVYVCSDETLGYWKLNPIYFMSKT